MRWRIKECTNIEKNTKGRGERAEAKRKKNVSVAAKANGTRNQVSILPRVSVAAIF